MTAREFDPFRLDVSAFAKGAAKLEGRWPLAQFDRLDEAAVVDAAGPEAVWSDVSEVAWSARGERRSLQGGDLQVWLHVSAATVLPLECQRCLKPVSVPLHIERRFLFVHGEDAAAQLDAQSEDDVLALTRALDLRELIEDELLLALPLVPRHETCPVPLRPDDDLDATVDKPNPFAALVALKRPDPL